MLVAIYEGGIMGVVSLIGGVSGAFLGVVSFDGRSEGVCLGRWLRGFGTRGEGRDGGAKAFVCVM